MQEEDEGCAGIIWSISEGWEVLVWQAGVLYEQPDKWGKGCVGGGVCCRLLFPDFYG
jgi:hypothetical protein